MGKLTDEMERDFAEHRNGIDSFIDSHSQVFDSDDLAVYLSSLYEQINKERKSEGYKPLKKKQIADLGGLTESFVYSLFNGARSNPERDSVIKLSFGMGLNVEQSNALLRKVGKGELYIRNERDCVVLYFLHRFDKDQAENRLLTECNLKLRELGLEELK